VVEAPKDFNGIPLNSFQPPPIIEEKKLPILNLNKYVMSLVIDFFSKSVEIRQGINMEL